VLAEPVRLAEQGKTEIRKRCCTPEISASTPSWPSPDISGST